MKTAYSVKIERNWPFPDDYILVVRKHLNLFLFKIPYWKKVKVFKEMYYRSMWENIDTVEAHYHMYFQEDGKTEFWRYYFN